jgi:hypothetical protein
MKFSEAYPYLKEIADMYGLKLNRVDEFRLARMLLVNLYGSEFN